MNIKDLFGGVSDEEMKKYAAEAEQKYGGTEEYKQSMERVKKIGKLGMIKVAMEQASITKALTKTLKEGKSAEGEEVQKLIQRHYESLRAFYEPNLEMYKGLAEMYVSDERFRSNYEKIAPGLAEFLKKGMLYYVEQQKKK